MNRQITSGEFVCTGRRRPSTRRRGRCTSRRSAASPVRIPYFPHLYRANIDTGEIETAQPGQRVARRPDERQGDVLRRQLLAHRHGARVRPLRRARQQGHGAREDRRRRRCSRPASSTPKPFSVKADDGLTDLYGTMYKPFDFDPSKKYPVVLYVYPGPQTESVTKTFSPRNANVALAQCRLHRRSRSATAAATRSARSGTTTTATATSATTACPTRRRRSSSSPSAMRGSTSNASASTAIRAADS